MTIADASCSLSFDDSTGALAEIVNVPLHDSLLKAGRVSAPPFRVHADLPGEWLLDTDPEIAARTHLSPGHMELKDARRARNGRRLTLLFEAEGIECTLLVRLAARPGESEWALSVRNTGAVDRALLIEFPRFDGVRLGPVGAKNLATFLNQAGYLEDAKDHPGGVYGNGAKWSMQWHAVFDPDSRSAFGFMVKDPLIRNKMLLPSQQSLAVRYFPPHTLAPGQSLELPPTVLLVYQGDWKRTARAYGRWYGKAFPHAKLPAWSRRTDVFDGRHFKKKSPGGAPDHGGQLFLESFRELPEAHLRAPVDLLEYAFWTRGSMLHNVHTDGDNVIREDLGGPEAMRQGIAGVHRLGLHATFYIEGYIVHQESNLSRDGKAREWSVMHRDGSITGSYTAQGFFHMCPGCVEWQDHLVSVVSRILRQTGADGIRLDSLGFYYLPCYNPEHHHETPFGYNQWMQELLAKVREAAMAVNARALLMTEAPVDFYGQWFHGALTQEYPRGIPPMRLAVKPYRYFAYSQSGPVWGSLSGSSGGRTGWDLDMGLREGNWLCAQPTILDALVEGDVADEDPLATDPGIVTRRYIGKQCEVVVAARPEGRGLRLPAYSTLSDRRAPYTIHVPVAGASNRDMAICDLETLEWSRLAPLVRNGAVAVRTKSNWLLLVIPRAGVKVVGFDPLPDAGPGDEVTITTSRVAGRGNAAMVDVWAPGLKVGGKAGPRAAVSIGKKIVVRVPRNAVPGLYQVRIQGKNVLGIKRLLRVRAV